MSGNGTAAMTVAGAAITPGPTLAKVDNSRAFEPGSIQEAFRLAEILSNSGLLPRGAQRPEAAFAIIATGRELGLTAMMALRSIHVIEGKPSLSADLVAALVKTRPDVCKYFRLVESTDKVATYETLRVGEPSPTKMSFTWEDAQRAGVTGKDNWKKYPAAMLRARCITALARAVFPDLAMGLYDPDELGASAAPGTYEVVPTVPTPPKSEPKVETDSKVFEELCTRTDAAETPGQLNAVARDAGKAHKAGQLSDQAFDALKRSVTSKRTMAARPPPDPPSGPMIAGEDDDGAAHAREPGEEG